MVEGALNNESLAAIESHVDTCEQCAAVIAGLGALDSSAMKPRVVGRYQLDRRIGGGGMGEVWAAWDPQLRRDIAVKLVKPERADDGRERERLLREARALAQLTHPNVLAVYDVGETDNGEVFIATELVVGDTLASRGGANADWRQLVKFYAQAARGLAAAHARGLVHRDIKPANLLIGKDGNLERVRVADFGLAVKSATPSPIAPTELASNEEPQITQTGYIAGTPAYMAPEQRLGEPADARADQYALCVALAEGIAGRRPPLDVDRDALIAFVAERRPRDPDLDRLCGVMARGLSIVREDRFPDADALADALEATTAPTTQTIPVTVRGRRAWPFVVGGALASVIAVVAVWQLRSKVSAAVQPVAVHQVDAAPAPLPSPVTTPSPTPTPTPAVAPTTPGSAATVVRPAIDPEEQADAALVAARKAANKRDGRACLTALANVPAKLKSGTHRTVEMQRAMCEMLAGQCDAGKKRMDQVLDASGLKQDGDSFATLYCPIEGAHDVKLARLVAQGHTRDSPAICRSYLEPARKLARETTAANEKAVIGGVMRSIAACVGVCSEAEALWKEAFDLDQIPMQMDIKGCAKAPPPQTPADKLGASVTSITDQINKAQQGIVRRDFKACKALITSPPTDVPQGMQQSIDLVTGACQMVTGNCKVGADLVSKAYGNSVPAITIESNMDTYCPITGTLDQRSKRIEAQLNAFADRRDPKPGIAWCAYLAGPAKVAAAEAKTDAQRAKASENLQRIAACLSTAGRCDEARDLWTLSGSTEPAPRCP
jgi:serine/threonine protein kinase